MGNVRVLDCTLRDGGYCNAWEFDKKTVLYIVQNLIAAEIDVIELGYLNEQFISDKETTIYNSYDDIIVLFETLKNETGKSKFAVMINHGEFDIEKMPVCDEAKVSIIRYAFHKRDVKSALKNCRLINEKGYAVFLQPMVTNAYSEQELIELVEGVNELKPNALYIVDSFGSISQEQLIMIYDMLKQKLDANIEIGFHPHNNMQLSFSNSIFFVKESEMRNIIVDATVMGIGRGAGNLNIELFAEWLNLHISDCRYCLRNILKIADNVINRLLEANRWGYSLAYYLSAIHNCHPKYAQYLSDKKTLLYEDLNNIFARMSDEKKYSFDFSYIENLYSGYLSRNTFDDVEEQKETLLFENQGTT